MRIPFQVSLLSLCLMLVLPTAATSQDSEKLTNPLSIGLRGHYGFIIPHSKAIADIAHANPWGIEADLALHLMRESTWKYCYCYPRTGLSLSWFNFNMPEVLGHSLALYPYIEPYIRPHNKLSISFRFGLGPAWVTRIYDPDTNPENIFFSYHLSFIAMLNAALNYRFASRTTARLAFNYNHISNGGLKHPNLGMNFPTLNLGMDYSIPEASFPTRARDTMRVLYPDHTWWEIYLLGTWSNITTGDERYFPVFGMGAYYNLLVSRIVALNTGTEFISDFSEKEKIRMEYIQDPASAPGHNRAAVLLGFKLIFGRISLLHQWGAYYYTPYPARQHLYQRYGMNLRIGQHFFTGFNIKAHGHVADLMDLRLGFRF